MPRLLVVEDDPRLRRSIAISLKARQFAVDEAANALDAWASIRASVPDLVLLDLGLPDMDGLALLGRIRGTSRVPIIVLSARQQQSDKVDALEAGADDYVTKPFGLEELVARIRVALRRSSSASRTVVSTATFTLDFDARTAVRGNEEVRLTPTEWLLAEALVRRAGTAVSADQLLSDVWGTSDDQRHYLRIYLGRLRRKLEEDPARPAHFITVPRMGYRFQH